MKLIQKYYIFVIFLSSVKFSEQNIIQYDAQNKIENTLTKLKNIFNIYYPNGQGNILFVIQYDPNNLSDKLMNYIGIKSVNLVVLNVVHECNINFLIRQVFSSYFEILTKKYTNLFVEIKS